MGWVTRAIVVGGIFAAWHMWEHGQLAGLFSHHTALSTAPNGMMPSGLPNGMPAVRRSLGVERVDLEGPAYVVDGNTLSIAGERVRLAGVDAPLRGQSCLNGGREILCGRRVSFELSRFIGGAVVRCKYVGWRPDPDSFEPTRTAANCSVHGRDLASWMVMNGYAAPYHSLRLAVTGLTACDNARGVWAGSFIRPASLRRHVRPEMIGRADGANCLLSVSAGALG